MKHILLLEDDRSIVNLLLEEDGCYISSTARVADATEILQKTKVDLLIPDIVLSDSTAFAAIDEAKRRSIAYLLMTGSWPHMA
jgi:DNA-binding NtrC family response regulator